MNSDESSPKIEQVNLEDGSEIYLKYKKGNGGITIYPMTLDSQGFIDNSLNDGKFKLKPIIGSIDYTVFESAKSPNSSTRPDEVILVLRNSIINKISELKESNQLGFVEI